MDTRHLVARGFQQHAALLQLLAGESDLTVAGLTDDRLGRAVVGLTATPHLETAVEYTLLISQDTGRIIGTEGIFRTSTVLPAGTVHSYRLWDVEMP